MDVYVLCVCDHWGDNSTIVGAHLTEWDAVAALAGLDTNSKQWRWLTHATVHRAVLGAAPGEAEWCWSTPGLHGDQHKCKPCEATRRHLEKIRKDLLRRKALRKQDGEEDN